MPTSARNTYLATQVLTASPAKLHLTLIEAAIRSARQASALWRAGRIDEAGQAIDHCQELVSELLAGLRPELAPQLVGDVASVYLFVFRRLTAAALEHNQAPLEEAISTLEIERDTWREVCNLQSPSAG